MTAKTAIPSVTAPPSSPPTTEYDISVASPSSPAPRGRLPEKEEQLLSPQISRLPLPRTPASTRSRHRDTSSEYYTAAWGSPYERSTSPTGSARTALSEQVPSEDQLESSPIPSFGLEHLVPSRLADLDLPRLSLPYPSRPAADSRVEEEEEDNAHTPRSRTKRWVQLPQRQQSERTRWWSDESQSVSEKEEQQSKAGASSEAGFGPSQKSTGHKPRGENLTLNQQSFLDILRERRSEDMSSLYASRWAATPPSDEDVKKPEGLAINLDTPKGESSSGAGAEQIGDGQDVTEQPSKGMTSGKGVGGDEDAVPYQGNGRGAITKASEPGLVEPASRGSPNEITNAQDPGRLEPPRLKKRVSWKGKTCIISIPNFDFEMLGLPTPMSVDEVQQRLKKFEDEGYSTRGFEISHDVENISQSTQVKDIWPDERELHLQASQHPPKVLLPDLNKMKAEADRLIEERLAALGVGKTGDEEPPLPPAPLGQPAHDTTRQSSGQYPPLPFSPPIPSGSGGSMGRPPIMRGHSHTMSVASPLSPGNGPFGHMHRHSTFSGPTGFPQLQTQLPPQQFQQAHMPGVQSFSPQKPFTMPGFPRGGSPAQLAALRQDVGPNRGPASPLSQQMFGLPSPQDYSRGLVEDQRRRQHGYSQSVQQQPKPTASFPPMPIVLQTPNLPELPEEDDEEELREPSPEPIVHAPEPPAYVPPHKRAQFNADVAVPTPTRGHQHNISEGFERDILEAEQRQEADKQNWIEVTEQSDESTRNTHRSAQRKPAPMSEHEPLARGSSVSESAHSYKKSGSRFNVAAPSFTFNPTASFEPKSTAFTFDMPRTESDPVKANGHVRQTSSGSFNGAAPAFKPRKPLSVPKSDFSFASSGPAFKPGAPSSEPPDQDAQDRTIIDDLPSIFGKVKIPDIVKPVRKSRAVAIIPPSGPVAKSADSGEELEDEEGRPAQSDDRLKRQRFGGADGDEVPKFAEPTPMPEPADFLVKGPVPADEPAVKGRDIEQDSEQSEQDVSHTKDQTDEVSVKAQSPPDHSTEVVKPFHGHKASSSLSALAKPFQPPTLETSVSDGPRKAEYGRAGSVSELEDGEIEEDETPAVSPVHLHDLSAGNLPAQHDSHMSHGGTATGRIDQVAHADPSFDEIDAVMRQLNETGPGAEDDQRGNGALSPLPSLDDQPLPGVTYLPEWPRSDAPSPSPRRQEAPYNPFADGSHPVHDDHTDSGEPAMNGGWPGVHRLNKAEDVQASDWSDLASEPEQDKLYQRSAFFDNHVDDLIGRVVERRLMPLEESLRSISDNFSRRTRSADRPTHKRTSSTVESDADDEDELSDERRNRPISRGRDKRIDQIKTAMLEALREQSPRRSQSSYDITDLHSALADMKVSFARAASASLELDDIRHVVEDVLQRKSQANVPVTAGSDKGTHKRELSELEGRLNETLAGALEEANHRRAVEEREAETRRLLRLAEEELYLLRDSSRDEDGRISAMEEERRELRERAERAEDGQQDAEQNAKSLEAENEAMQATLEEYRTSSNKWRQDIDEARHQREELENTVGGLERQVEDAQESSNSMKRRLERLHSDMATAAGQLAGEKATWKAREEDYRARCEFLEAQQTAQARERHQELEDELHLLRASHAEARLTLDDTRASNASLEEIVRRLQSDLAEQQSLAARYERDFEDAKEAGRSEVQRTRMSFEMDLEAANHQVNIVRAELGNELVALRTEVENVKIESEIANARHERILEEEDAAKREALRKVNHTSSVALDEARQKHEAALQEHARQHHRLLQHAMEDKERSEYILNERLVLADAKLEHSQDRILHLEERLEVTKSAAQAAAMSAQTRAAPAAVTAFSAVPEKVSPQALRESILVLQEQLQEREARIDRLQNEVDQEGPAKLAERDSEITWLRELLAVRSEDLTDLVNTLSQPTFNRDTVRDIAIRIRANLQMEQQEKERFGYDGQSLGGQALASLSSFATPKAAQLTSAFSKWRATMESSALRNAPRAPPRPRSNTPSKPVSSSGIPPSLMAGLMTPPASNLRNTPSPKATTSLPPPRLNSRAPAASERPRSSRQVSDSSEGPTTPLFREQSYDHDAEDSKVHMQSFEDDDLDIADSAPPAFRSLEAELEPSAVGEEAN